MEKFFIKNRKGQKVSVLVEEGAKGVPLAFVMHGLGGWKDQPYIKTFSEAFLENGFVVVRFDTTNSFGESDGTYEDATTTNYYEDLEDVISWAREQLWYREPFYLAGHSLGGICTALYAEKYPEKVAGLAPISTVVAGRLGRGHSDEEMQKWKETGWLEEQSQSKPGLMKRLKWSHMVDRMQYDLLPEAGRLSMPVLLIVGKRDKNCPPAHQKILFDALPGPKEIHIIPGAPHTFREPEHLQKIKQILDKWIEKYTCTKMNSKRS